MQARQPDEPELQASATPDITGRWRYFLNIVPEELTTEAVKYFAQNPEPCDGCFWMFFDEEHNGLEGLKNIKAKILAIIQTNPQEDWATLLHYEPRTLPKLVTALFAQERAAKIKTESILFILLNHGTKGYTSGIHPMVRPTESMKKLFAILDEQQLAKVPKLRRSTL